MQDTNLRPRRSDGKNNRSLFRRTIFLMAVLGVGIFLPLVYRLYQLQIVEQEDWERRAATQQTRSISVPANRGTIYDREGRAMAMSATVYKLILSPRGVVGSIDKEKYKDKEKNLDETAYEKALYDLRETIVDGIVDLFGYDEERLWTRIERTSSGYEVLYYELEEEDAEKARQFISKNRLSGALQLTPSSKRYYPFSSIGSHVLGYMGQTESSGENMVGKDGIEALYEGALSGELGRVVTSKNGWGQEMISGYEMYFDAQNGYDVHLTIDERIQAMLEQTLAEGIETYDVQAGAFGLAIDPQTGAVLAMASSPDFDPNNWGVLLSEALQEQVEQVKTEEGDDAADAAWREAWNKQMRNRVLKETYEPGSVFKPITVAIGLEEGVISLDSTYNCSGSKKFPGVEKPINCHKKGGHGQQNLTKAVGNSCNVALMNIAEEIGPEITWKYWQDFGLMEKTGIDLSGEEKGIFWTEEHFKSINASLELATSSFGQRFKVTPLEMITAFAAVINGGHLLQPYVVQSITDGDGNTTFYHETVEVRQVISESTSEKMRGILESVVANDSGHNASQIGYRIGGKTGTSELLDRKNEPGYNKDVMCSFMGFAPADDPRVLVLVVYDTPKRDGVNSSYTAGGTYISGGNIAAPMAGALIANILDYMGIEKQYSADELAGAAAPMPYVVGSELTVAKGAVQNAGFECRTVGTGNVVTHQVPAAGVSIPGGSNVILYLGEEAPDGQVATPDLEGLSPAAAKTKLEEQGLFMRATGVVDYTDSSVVMAAQSVDAGTMVTPGTVIEVRFVSDIEYGDHA
ncbi:MAG: PASTA domain-containing protein [Oscillospiraceae bacterium]|nr:PASTA domain-containing protein [Oscillospiraceae bacterium]